MSSVTRSRPKTDMVLDRAPPADVEAEISVLGSIMLLGDVIVEVSAVLDADDFYDDAHRKIYRALKSLHDAKRPVDWLLLTDELQSRGEHESVGGAAYLGKLMDAVPNAAHAIYYATIVREKAVLRRLIEAATDILRRAYSQEFDPAEQVATAEHAIQQVAIHAGGNVGQARRIASLAQDVLTEFMTSLDSGDRPGYYSGIGDVDQQLGPLMNGELTILAARPGNGKTAMAMQYANEQTRRGKRVFFASLEMPSIELARREVSREAGIDSRDMRSMLSFTHEEIDGLHAAVAAFQERDPGLWVWRKANATIPQIRAAARKVKQQDGCDLLIVDHILWLRPSGPEKYMDRRDQIGIFTKALKEVATELESGLLVLWQLNRDAQDVPPTLKNLRESGAGEEDADCVLFLYHPPGAGNGKESWEPRPASLIIGKHRHVAQGEIPMSWTPAETRFGDPTSELP